jgi:hypothetical protein
MYEFAIASGCLFATLMLHSLYSALSSERRSAWMALAGAFLGLSVGCRPTFLLAILAPAWVLWSLLRQDRPGILPLWTPGRSARPVMGFAVGFGAIFSGLLLYNYLRFSNFLDFGYGYLLQDPVADLKHVWSPSYFLFNLRLYYVGSLEWSRHFPFATMGPLPKWPQHYYGCADIYGILKYAPVVWFLLASPLALRRGPAPGPRHFATVLGMVGLAYLGLQQHRASLHGGFPAQPRPPVDARGVRARPGGVPSPRKARRKGRLARRGGLLRGRRGGSQHSA